VRRDIVVCDLAEGWDPGGGCRFGLDAALVRLRVLSVSDEARLLQVNRARLVERHAWIVAELDLGLAAFGA
jgi:hypothetical protein